VFSFLYTNKVRFFILHVAVHDIILLLIDSILQDAVIHLDFTTPLNIDKVFFKQYKKYHFVYPIPRNEGHFSERESRFVYLFNLTV